MKISTKNGSWDPFPYLGIWVENREYANFFSHQIRNHNILALLNMHSYVEYSKKRKYIIHAKIGSWGPFSFFGQSGVDIGNMLISKVLKVEIIRLKPSWTLLDIRRHIRY